MQPTVLQLDVLEGSLGVLLRNAHLAVHREFLSVVGRGEIRTGTFGAMVLVGANPGILQSELVMALVLDKAALTELLNELQRGSLVTRKRSTRDRRRSGVFLTPEGAVRLGELKQRFAAFDTRLRSLLSPEENALLVALLRRLCAWRGSADPGPPPVSGAKS